MTAIVMSATRMSAMRESNSGRSSAIFAASLRDHAWNRMTETTYIWHDQRGYGTA